MQAAAPPIAPIAGGDELRDGHANDDAEGATAAPPGFVIDPALATSLGLDEETRRALLGSFGFRAIGEPALQRWRWSGLRKAADKRPRRKKDRKDRNGSDAAPRAATNGAVRRPPAVQGKDKRGKPGKPRLDTPRQI